MTSLLEAFGLNLPEMVAIIGSGGKTSLMFALAAEAVGLGGRVVTTTTTKIWVPRPDQSPQIILHRDRHELRRRTRRALAESGQATVALYRNKDDKLVGPAPETVDAIMADWGVDLLLVEADGARGMALKAPDPKEPVIPSRVDIVIPVVGLGGLGRPLDGATVFRPDRFERLSEIRPGDPVTAEGVGRVLFHPEGLCRDAGRARIIPFLNQADLVGPGKSQNAAHAILRIGNHQIDRIVWGSLQDPDLGVHMMTRETAALE